MNSSTPRAAGAHGSQTASQSSPPVRLGWRRIATIAGPGLVLAAAGVGAGDLVSSLNAGASFGLTLVWAVVVGVVIKFVVTESIGRWHLATGVTPIQGFNSLGKWLTVFFVIYAIILGFFYGAAISSAIGLTINAMFTSIPVWVAAIGAQVVGVVLVWIGRYRFFESIMALFVGLMFVSIVGAAVLSRPSIDVLLAGFQPTIPTNGAFYVLGLIGGVGMSIGLLSYGRWMKQRGWSGPEWIRAMRLDLIIGYVMTFIFMVAMMVVGAAFVQSAEGIQGVEGFTALADPFGEQYGPVAKWFLLIGMFSAVFSSLVGGYNALANVFTDIVHVLRNVPTEEQRTERLPVFRGYLLWMGIPPLALLFLQEPVLVVLVYAALGALFMPVLIAGLLVLMNSKRIGPAHRNRWWTNVVAVLCLGVYVVLGVNELMNL